MGCSKAMALRNADGVSGRKGIKYSAERSLTSAVIRVNQGELLQTEVVASIYGVEWAHVSE